MISDFFIFWDNLGLVQEDLAISPCRLYESYFLLLILDVNFVKLQTKYTYNKRGSVTSSEKMAHKIGYSVYHSGITVTKTRKKRWGMGEKNNCLTLVFPAIVVSMWNTKRPLLVKCVPLTRCVLSRLANVCSWTWYFLHYDTEETWGLHTFFWSYLIFGGSLLFPAQTTNENANVCS